MTSGALPPAPFGRVLTAMVTPFAEDGSLDLDGCAAVASHLADHGHDGVVVAGTTGEAPTVSDAETAEAVRVVVDTVGDRCRVVAGVGTNDTRHSFALAQHAEKAGAQGLLVVSPYYSKPTQAGLAAHVETVTAATGLPVMLYDIPGRTGVTFAEDTIARLAENDQVVAVKDAVGDLARGVRVMGRTGLTYYSGDDALNLGWLTHGAAGVVSVVGHAAGDGYRAMTDAVDAGDLAGALETYRRLAPLVSAFMDVVPGVATAKAAMQLLGVIDSRATRLPLLPADDDVVRDLADALRAAGILPEGTV